MVTRTLIILTLLFSYLGGYTAALAANDPAPTGTMGQEPAPAPSATPAIQQGQIIKITVYREPDLSGSFEVDDTGSITYPLIGRLVTAGKTAQEVREDVATGLKKFIIDPQVSVTLEVKKSDKGQVSGSVSSMTVLGEVRSPGTYESEHNLTLTKLIAMAGGSTPTADTKKVKVIRTVEGEQKVFAYNIDDINNAKIKDPVLAPGDKIVVPQEEKDVNTVALLGEVKSAGIYEVTPGFTLMRVIAKAGGFTPLASTGKVRLVRQEGKQKKIYLFNAGAIINGDADDPEVKAGDMIFIPESFF